jgi:uncharacterized membrane protein YdbT with pleckstrin-like domain
MRTNLKNGEQVFLTTRQHWFPCFFTPLLFTLLFLIVGIRMETGQGFLYLLSFLSACLAAYRAIQRQYNIWVVTNLRVIDENGVVSLLSIDSPLDKINNVSYRQGLVGRIFGYGDVEVQTAAGHGVTIYPNVEHPALLKDTITTMQEEYKKSSGREQTRVLSGLLSSNPKTTGNISIATELEKIYELKQKGVLTDEEYNLLKVKILNS